MHQYPVTVIGDSRQRLQTIQHRMAALLAARRTDEVVFGIAQGNSLDIRVITADQYQPGQYGDTTQCIETVFEYRLLSQPQ